jgi:hypothetical protein
MNVMKAFATIPKENLIFKDADRLLFLHAHFAVGNFDTLMKILNKHAMQAVTPGTTLSGDEATYAYKPGYKSMKEAELQGVPIPKLHIPRKPHPIVTCQILLQQP